MSLSLEEVNRKVDLLILQVEDLTNALNQLRLGAGRSQAAGYSPLRSAAPSAAPASEGTSTGSNGIYNQLASEIPALPDFAASLCARLSGGTLSARARAERAWESGWWARYALEGRVSRPRPSRPIDLSNSCYIILRASGYECPILVLLGSDYRAIIQNFETDSISHGFPSRAEAKVFCLGAGVEFPLSVFQWHPSQ